ncbi:MAG: hypothetical protein KDD37_06160 [Bdellovibrionales bacterium]|nr:hypothetical protein [Bdellovibrionales bacterium]
MIKKIILLSMVFISACSPKTASVESKPFQNPRNDGFETLSMNDPIELKNASWFFWKNHDDMATVLQLGAGLEILQGKLQEVGMKKAALMQQQENFLLESLGVDNKVIWEEITAKIEDNTKQTTALQNSINEEEAKPEEERDLSHIEQLKQELATLEAAKLELIEQRDGVIQQSGAGAEFATTMENFKAQAAALAAAGAELMATAGQYQMQLSQLVELIPAPPKLILQEIEGSLYIELVDFKKGDIDCNTTTGLIRDVVYKKQEGYIEFTAICKQPENADPSQLVSYKLMIEKIPSTPGLLLSGNMGRCIDKLPNLGKCEAGLSAGVVKYSN